MKLLRMAWCCWGRATRCATHRIMRYGMDVLFAGAGGLTSVYGSSGGVPTHQGSLLIEASAYCIPVPAHGPHPFQIRQANTNWHALGAPRGVVQAQATPCVHS
jgi:hypothetical protein